MRASPDYLQVFLAPADQAGSLSAQALQAMHKEYGALSPIVNSATLLADSQQEVGACATHSA